jgi:outer membrane lipoprotein-sorting protein
MMNARIASFSALVFGAALLTSVAASAAAPSGPAAAFLEAWAKVSSYTANIKVHETKGTEVQDRTYHYAYLKPHFAKIDITGGPGRGGGAVWKGGDTITGHRGFPSFIRLTKSINDPEAVDLRGGTISQASFENVAENIKAAASATNGEETVNGTQYDIVTVPFKDANGATKRVIFLSRATHLPARRVTYAGDTVVETEDFTDVNTAANLKESDF